MLVVVLTGGGGACFLFPCSSRVLVLVSTHSNLKGRMQCFSMQVVMNKCFLLNPKKIGADPSCH